MLVYLLCVLLFGVGSDACSRSICRGSRRRCAAVPIGPVMLCRLTLNVQVQDYRAGCDAAASAVNELEQQKAKVKAELAEVCSPWTCGFCAHVSALVS